MDTKRFIFHGVLLCTLFASSGCSDVPAVVCQQGVACFTDLDAQAIFVDAQRGDDSAQGNREFPVRTLSKALAMLEEDMSKQGVAIAGSPTFEEALTIRRPVKIFGGYDDVFRIDESNRPRLFVAGSPAISVLGVQGDVYISRLSIEQTSPPSDRGAITVYIEDTRLITLSDCEIFAAGGASGVQGSDGEDGAPGVAGGIAGQGTKVEPGLGAINAFCAEANGANGGRGGDASTPASPGDESNATTQGGQLGGPGANGQSRDAGQRGQDATPGSFGRGGFIAGSPSTAGEQGLHGAGGGGGGGGRANGAQGGGGGGGASGGCAASPGQPGGSGMPSSAVVTVESDLRLINSSIIASPGGDAGKGGSGARGGDGAMGAPGSVGISNGELGGRGGNSSAGADSGAGGDGAAGGSYGVVCDGGLLTIEATTVMLADGGVETNGDNAESLATKNCTMR